MKRRTLTLSVIALLFLAACTKNNTTPNNTNNNNSNNNNNNNNNNNTPPIIGTWQVSTMISYVEYGDGRKEIDTSDVTKDPQRYQYTFYTGGTGKYSLVKDTANSRTLAWELLYNDAYMNINVQGSIGPISFYVRTLNSTTLALEGIDTTDVGGARFATRTIYTKK